MDAPLPKVVITTTASVDGRITLGHESLLLQPDVARRWSAMKPDGVDAMLGSRREEHGASVVLEGSGSFVGGGLPPAVLPRPALPEPELRRDFLPRRTPLWFVVADSRGRVDWPSGGDETTALLVLVCAATPSGYLQLLRDRGIGYLLAGEDRVDLAEGLSRIASVLGADTVVADAGGTMNAALLRAGLVDEIDVAVLPGLVGGAGTPSIMDGDPLGADGTPIRLELIDSRVGPPGVVRTRYRVVR